MSWKRSHTTPRQTKHRFLAVRVGYYVDYRKEWKYEYPVERGDTDNAVKYYKNGGFRVCVQYHLGFGIWV